ncbi:MAG: hypothetical protein M3405_02355 [Acidobacteriota bacterium]|jgi:signal transduction histidine kinase|nr:hypothetical protein [Acidobacteriota bacterium]
MNAVIYTSVIFIGLLFVLSFYLEFVKSKLTDKQKTDFKTAIFMNNWTGYAVLFSVIFIFSVSIQIFEEQQDSFLFWILVLFLLIIWNSYTAYRVWQKNL